MPAQPVARVKVKPNVMTLATVDADGQPSARIVLLKGASKEGFDFYTNYESQKGRELATNPKAALVFFWPALERQVRVTGVVTKLPRKQSEAYFHSRPRGSQLGAWVSHQSAVIEGRDQLETRMKQLEQEYAGQNASASAALGRIPFGGVGSSSGKAGPAACMTAFFIRARRTEAGNASTSRSRLSVKYKASRRPDGSRDRLASILLVRHSLR